MSTIYRKILVSGRVQGVFFRDSTRQMAAELNLSGGVRNLRDGRVEVLVAGDSETVHALIKWLKIGPKLAKVSTIEIVELASDSPQAQQCLQQSGHFAVWPTQTSAT